MNMKNMLFLTTMLLSFMGLFIVSDGKKLGNEATAPPTVTCTAWSAWQDTSACVGSTRFGTKNQKRHRQCTDGFIPIGSSSPTYYTEYQYQTVSCEVLVTPIFP